MRDPVKERATLAAKRDFDMLPRSTEIDVQPARRHELSAVAEMGNRMVPGVQIAEPDLERYFAFDPGSILTFSRQGQLLGAVAFLYLNRQGHDALMHALGKRALGESAIGAAEHIVAADDLGQPDQALGDQLRVLDNVGGVADDAGDEFATGRQLDVLPDRPFVLVARVGLLDAVMADLHLQQ